jgi:CDP-glucose 4,6-dehydratase
MSKNNILVTGFQGFIGSALCSRLKKNRDNRIIGLGFEEHHHVSQADTSISIYGDIRNADFIRRVIGDYEINTVYHLAAQSIVRVCANDPVSAYDINVMGTVRLLDACRTVGANTVKSVLVSTSDKAFGHSPIPYTEQSPLQPKFTYEATKSCQDIVAQNFFHNYGVPVKICRCSNVYGPGDPNESRVIPGSILRIARKERPWLYSDVAEYIREFVYIDDIVDAFTLVTEKANAGEIYCVGGTGYLTMKELIAKILKLCDSDIEPELIDKPSQFKEIPAQYIDSTKLRSLGWSPKWTLDAGLCKTIEYYVMKNQVLC